MIAASLEERVSFWHAQSKRLKARMPALKKKLQPLQARLEERSKSLADAQSGLDQVKLDYQAECRKLASGQASGAANLKQAIQETEAKIEGLKQLVAEDQRAVAEARAPLDALETELATAQLREKEARLFLKAETGLDRVSKQLLALMEEIEVASRAVSGVAAIKTARTYVQAHANRLFSLKQTLREAKARFF